MAASVIRLVRKALKRPIWDFSLGVLSMSMGRAGGPWTDGVTTEWLNSVLLELYRQGKLPAKRAQPGTPARVGGREGASRPEEANGAPRNLIAVR